MDLRPEISRDERCRCGHPKSSPHPHPCHAKGYLCRKPATQRFYNPRPACLAGMQMKLVVQETWACDACWAEIQPVLAGEVPVADFQWKEDENK